MVSLYIETIISIGISSLIIAYLIWLLFKKTLQVNQIISDQTKAIKDARKDSNERQRNTIKGQISETIAPWSMEAVNSVKELNFLGNPIDFIGFKGLDGKGDVEIKFIEVKFVRFPISGGISSVSSL